MKSFAQVALVSILGLMMLSGFAMPMLVKPVRANPLPTKLQAADLNNSGNVTLADFVGFAQIYGMTNSSNLWSSPIMSGWRNANEADFNGNGKIDLGDLVDMALAYSINRTA